MMRFYLVLLSVIVFAQSAQAQQVQRVKDLDRPATTVREWLSQTPPPPQAPIQVTGIRLNPTDAGLEIILQTASPTNLQTVRSVEGRTLTIEIPNVVLALPNQRSFQADTATETVTATAIDGNRIQVRVVGKTVLPNVTVIAQPNSVLQPPDADEEEITVTGDRPSRYRVPNATSATRTDTPIRDTPASIQVVPQQVIRDQQVVTVDEALRNVSAVGYKGAIDGRGYNFTIRGFDNAPVLRDGFRVYENRQIAETANLERIEVLKGPASILYGDVQPGGVINLVSKLPLSTSFREVELQVGSRNFVRPRLDLSAPLSEDGKILYRLNLLYQQNDSSRDYETQFRRFSVAPSLTFKLGDRTDFTTFLEYLNDKGYADFGQIIIGDELAKVPRSHIPNDPNDAINNQYLRVGYYLEHRFNDNLKLRNSFSYQNSRNDYNVLALPFTINPQTNILNRVFADQDGTTKVYSLQTNAIGKFTTGFIQHTVLAGVDLAQSERNLFTVGDFARPRPFNIFAPNYTLFPKPDRAALPFFSDFTTKGRRLGAYLQDQLSLFNNKLIFLAGVRYDVVDQTVTNITPRSTTETQQQDDAVTPRFGVVYKPLPELSLYGSYSRSFNPNTGVATFAGELLEPETGEGFEVGIKTELLDRRLGVTLSYFDLKKQNVAVADPQFFGFLIATGEQRSRGVELDVIGEIVPGWNIIGAYAYTDAKITKDTIAANIGSRLSNIPKHSGSLWTTYAIQRGSLKGLGFGIGFVYVGERFGGLPASYRADPYFLTNAALFYRKENWRAAINIKNLFNVDYVQSIAQNSRVRENYPGEPLTVIGSISLEF